MSPIPPMRADLGLGEGYHSPQVDAAVRLNTNESPIAPPQGWRDAVAAEIAAADWNRYPDRSAWALRKAVADLHGVAPDKVWCANGSNEVLQTLLLAYGGAGRTAAMWEPTYALHRHIAELTGTGIAEGQRAADFTLDEAEVRRVIDAHQPVITFLCSPNNPTGDALSLDLIRRVVDYAPGLTIVDEAYGQFARASAVDLVGDSAPLVVTRTYSKTWSLAGLRLGYCIAPPEVIAAMERAALPYHLDTFTQIAGRLALRYVDDMERRVAHIVEERGKVAAALADLPVDVWPSDANFILFRPRRRSGDEVWRGLLDRSVLIRNCSSWARLEDCLRVTIGTTEENVTFLSALAEVLV